MLRCPNCRARVTDTQTCRRCGMALDALVRMEAAAYDQLLLASSCLLRGKYSDALTALQRSRSLKDDPLSAHLLRFVSGLTQAREDSFCVAPKASQRHDLDS